MVGATTVTVAQASGAFRVLSVETLILILTAFVRWIVASGVAFSSQMRKKN
jgi:hypothetical protein